MPLSLPALRDAIGLARLLYATTDSADAARLAAVATAGRQLANALRFASMEAGSLGYRAAPMNAARGMAALAAVGWPADVAALIEAARARVGAG